MAKVPYPKKPFWLVSPAFKTREQAERNACGDEFVVEVPA